jgi:hypothetical protein
MKPDNGTSPASHPRTLLKCAWRCSRIKPPPASVEALMRSTAQIRRTFHLSEDEHRRCCVEALRRGESRLAADLFELETRQSQSNPHPAPIALTAQGGHIPWLTH